METSSQRDLEQLKLLEIFHYIMVFLAIGGGAFIAVHYMIMSTSMEMMLKDPKFTEQRTGPPFDPALFFRGFIWFYLFMAAWSLVSLIANLASGLCLRYRRHRNFSMIVAGFNCVNFPFGTALGVFTLIVLLRSTMSSIYDEPSLEISPTS
jgi:hypothetical protein